MSKVNAFLTQRLKQATEKLSKMTGLAELSASGNLSSFSGMFRIQPLSPLEQENLEALLSSFASEHQDISDDLQILSHLTSEVKAINNQAALLHGERIKKAQEILKKYKDGAFSSWLIAAYGNRQTPYNFLQYYEFHISLSPQLLPKLEEMPRQAIYALASRGGPLEKKEEIIANYQGQTKQELLGLIRETFPLDDDDRRLKNLSDQAIETLRRLEVHFKSARFRPTPKQSEELHRLFSNLRDLL